MNPAERRRESWHYEPHTPQCCNCVGYRKAQVDPKAPPDRRLTKPQCTKGKFAVEPNGCCDKWSNRSGERLA